MTSSRAIQAVQRLGLSAGGFEQHLVSEDPHLRTEESAHDFEELRLESKALKERVEPDHKGSPADGAVGCLLAGSVSCGVALTAHADTLGRRIRIGHDFVGALPDLSQVGV